MPIDAIDPKIEVMKSFEASKLKQAQNVSEKGMHDHPDEIKKQEDRDKTTVNNTDESTQENVDKDGRKGSDQNQDSDPKEEDEKEDDGPRAKDPNKGNFLDIKG